MVGKQGRSTFCTYICGNQKHQNRFLSICWYYRFSHFTFVLTVLSLNFSIIHDSMTRGLFVIRYTSYMSFFLEQKIDSESSLTHYTTLSLSLFNLYSSFPFLLPPFCPPLTLYSLPSSIAPSLFPAFSFPAVFTAATRTMTTWRFMITTTMRR